MFSTEAYCVSGSQSVGDLRRFLLRMDCAEVPTWRGPSGRQQGHFSQVACRLEGREGTANSLSSQFMAVNPD